MMLLHGPSIFDILSRFTPDRYGPDLDLLGAKDINSIAGIHRSHRTYANTHTLSLSLSRSHSDALPVQPKVNPRWAGRHPVPPSPSKKSRVQQSEIDCTHTPFLTQTHTARVTSPPQPSRPSTTIPAGVCPRGAFPCPGSSHACFRFHFRCRRNPPSLFQETSRPPVIWRNPSAPAQVPPSAYCRIPDPRQHLLVSTSATTSHPCYTRSSGTSCGYPWMSARLPPLLPGAA